MSKAIIRVSLLSVLWIPLAFGQGESEKLLKEALGDDQVSGDWVYEDIEAGYAKARKTGKPLLVSFR
ncbi:MAG: hypothetical protein CMJ83_07090 [Planctomycetes bacterium]|nr:hypothetical protein [Planctomycetota bacterium]